MTSKVNAPEIKIIYKGSKTKTIPITCSKDAHNVIKEYFDQGTIEYSEEFLCLYLDRSHRGIGWLRVSSGGLDAALADVRKIISVALSCGAHSLICAHNHPSSQLEPSRADLKLTEDLNQSCELLQLSLLDHIIVTGDPKEYYSFADNGRI